MNPGLSATRRAIAVAVLAMLGLTAPTVWGQEDESFTADIEGRKTWTVRYGIGHPLGLAGVGLAPGGLSLDQTLAVDLRAEALSVLTVEGHFDDQGPESMQSLAMYLDTERLDGVLGDFTAAGIEAFTAYPRKVKGLRLDYSVGDAVLTAIASRLEGVSTSVTFVGQTADGEVVYSASVRDRPWVEPSYARHIDGLLAYPLDVPYVAEFTDVVLSIEASDSLRNVLQKYGVDVLFDVLSEEPDQALDQRQFTVIGDDTQTLLLNEGVETLLRDRLERALERYNEEHDLSGDEEMEYPFSPGSDYEAAFLKEVSASAELSVDGETHPLASAVRRRFYNLGQSEVLPDSVAIAVSLDGRTFTPITHPDFVDYDVTIYPEDGVIELRFPDVFHDVVDRAVRVSFRHTLAGGTYSLGLGIIPGSERVAVNEEPITRDTDYVIDYEIGLLILSVDVSEDDVIRVDYERFSGGLGGEAEYARYLLGVSLDLPVSESFQLQAHVLRAVDDPNSVADPGTARSMPNQQTVGGVLGSIALDGFSGDFALGYGVDRFPFDDNQKASYPNAIVSIASSSGFTFFGHSAGVSVWSDRVWQSYDASDGLSGRAVRAIAVDSKRKRVYFGTNAGLTVVSLLGISPLDRVGNWERYYEEDGLPDGSIRALVVHNDTLWIGTDGGVVSVPSDALDDPSAWTARPLGEAARSRSIHALAGEGETLWIGTDAGLFRHNSKTQETSLVVGTSGLSITDLLIVEGALYVASDRGVRTFVDGVGTGWVVAGRAVHSLAAHEGTVYFATGDGLARASDDAIFYENWIVTAVGAGAENDLWVGSQADDEGRLMIWQRGATEEVYSSDTTKIDGRDPFRFVDLRPDEHTNDGVLGRASFHRTGEIVSLSGALEVASAGYRAIGSLGRRDAMSWELDGTADLGDGTTVAVSHGYTMEDLAGFAPRGRLQNSLSFTGTFGPVVSFSLQQESANTDFVRNGAETSYIGYQLSLDDRLFGDVLRLAVSWSDAYTQNREYGTSRHDSRLSSRVTFVFSPKLSIAAGWARPILERDEVWSGSERWSLTGNLSQRVFVGDLSLDYEFDRSRALPPSSFTANHKVDLAFDWDSFDAGDWRFTPVADFTFEHRQGKTSLAGRAVLRTAWGGLAARTTLSGDVSGLGEPLQRLATKLTASISHSELAPLEPSLTYTGNRRTTRYEGVGTVVSTDHFVSGRVTWAPETGAYDALSFSLRIREEEKQIHVTASMENTLQFDLSRQVGSWLSTADPDRAAQEAWPTAGIRVDTNGEVRRQGDEADVSLSVASQIDVALSETWSGWASATYLMTSMSGREPTHSMLLELSVAVDF
jgi:hypothetical protein